MDANAIIRTVLIDAAKRGSKLTYGDLGVKVGRTARGPWPKLDQLLKDEKDAGRPDLTLLVVTKKSELPSVFLQKPLDPRNLERVHLYEQHLRKLFDFYSE
ncbi:MAG: hypothetical protein JJ855_04390 [Rhodospirillales bacterium]|nr:hypothetical protein [Rhodospirillales bacterium]